MLLPLAALACGTIANDPDPDERRVRLTRAGDGVRLHLALPPGVRAEQFGSAEILLDCLPSVRGEFDLSVRLSGREVGRFEGRPPSRPEAFLLDEEIHGEGERYRRVLRSMERHLADFVRQHRGLRNAGYDYYRQWYRVQVPVSQAFCESDAVLEVVLLSARGGSVDLFLDRDAEAGEGAGRVVRMPAFFENPYELSSYRFDALASRRELADARLIRPIRVRSKRLAAVRFDAAGQERALRGEPRMRVLGKRQGVYGLVRGEGGGVVPAIVRDPGQALRLLKPPEIRLLQADRDRYESFYLTF